jgi:hypothetical protein
LRNANRKPDRLRAREIAALGCASVTQEIANARKSSPIRWSNGSNAADAVAYSLAGKSFEITGIEADIVNLTIRKFTVNPSWMDLKLTHGEMSWNSIA